MTTYELSLYYAGLLILQYIGKPRAYATVKALTTPVIMPQTSVQTIAFSLAPTSGSFVLSYDGVSSAAINWNDSNATILTKIQAITAATVLVTGEIADQLLTVTFEEMTPPTLPLMVESNSLLETATPVQITVTETDETLPLAVQNGFNLIPPNTAVGVQLDTIGKYAGVVRTGAGFTGQITLDDADFLSLIKLAIIKNSSGSSLYDIQNLIHIYFSGEILVFDYQNMQMSYLVSTAVGSRDLLELFISQGLLPRPMAVQVALIIYAPIITNFFGFRTYENPSFNNKPFNSYADYHLDWPWLSYAYAITP